MGVPGELLIGGAGLAKGYLNEPQLTAQKFLELPSSADEVDRWYLSGDRCRWLADGTIEFLGRQDSQVKIGGMRIELGEIEEVLKRHPLVQTCAVVAQGDTAATKRLTAFIVAAKGSTLKAEALRKYCSEQLPAQWIPSDFAEVDKLPLTPNGKLDRKQLAALPLESRVADGERQPATDVERRLAAIWAEHLKLHQPPVNRSFFTIGGQSFLALRMLAAVNREFGTHLPLGVLLQAPSIEALAAVIGVNAATTKEQDAGSVLVPIARAAEGVPLILIHDGSGAALAYRKLTDRLTQLCPLYALETTRPESDWSTVTIEAIARQYIDTVRQTLRHGPYRLAGFSLGGIVAYEMARQLRQIGEDVDLLVIFDVSNPSAPPRQRTLRQWCAHHAASLRGRPLTEKLRYLAKRAAGKLLANCRLGSVAGETSSLDSAMHLARRYRPEPYDGRVLLFVARNKPGRLEFADDLGWRRVVPALDIRYSSADHLSLLKEPYVAEIASHLSEALKPHPTSARIRGGHPDARSIDSSCRRSAA